MIITTHAGLLLDLISYCCAEVDFLSPVGFCCYWADILASPSPSPNV